MATARVITTILPWVVVIGALGDGIGRRFSVEFGTSTEDTTGNGPAFRALLIHAPAGLRCRGHPGAGMTGGFTSSSVDQRAGVELRTEKFRNPGLLGLRIPGLQGFFYQ